METRHPFVATAFACRIFSALLALAAALPGRAQTTASTYSFSHLAGSTSGPGYTDGASTVARFYSPGPIAADNQGNLYVGDGNETVRKITPAGVVTTLAGKAGFPGSADGPAATARFNHITGVAIDRMGRVLVADGLNRTIRRISPQGTVETLAGAAGQQGRADGIGTAARFYGLGAVAIDPADNLYAIDINNGYLGSGWQTIRKITPAGVVTTLNLRDASGQALSLFQITAIATDLSGQIYFVNVRSGTQSTIYRATPDGVATSIAGNGSLPPDYLSAMTVDAAGNLYLTYPVNLGTNIVKASPTGQLLASFKPLRNPGGIAVDSAGKVYVTDNADDTIRRIADDWNSAPVFAGSTPTAGSADGNGVAARFDHPWRIALGTSGELFVADLHNGTVRRISATGDVTTYAGKAGEPYIVDGPPAIARLGGPLGVARDSAGNLYVTEQSVPSIRKIAPDGTISTFAGASNQGGREVDGTGTEARFTHLGGMTIDRAGNLFVTGLDTLRKITPAGVVTTIGGAFNVAGATDGPLAGARFFQSSGIVADRNDNLYIADSSNHTVRKVSADGIVSTLAGTAGVSGQADGQGAAARFYHPSDVAVDNDGNVFVTDSNETIRKITPGGLVTTIGGAPGYSGSEDGIGAEARFQAPDGIAVDASGNLYITEALNHTVRKGVPAAGPVITQQPASQTVAVGGTAQFSVAAAGTPAPSYQWYFNGTPISGMTGSSLNLTGVRTADAGEYSVAASNNFGSTTSSKAVLTVTTSTNPPGNPSPGGGGGGAPSTWFLLALAGLGWMRRRLRQTQISTTS